MKEIKKWQEDLKTSSFEGIGRFDHRVLEQEGLPHDETYRNWRKDCKDKLKKLSSFKGNAYKIPPIEHAVFFTSNSSPKELKDEYVQKLSDTAKRLKAVNPNFRHILWTNNPNIRDMKSVQKILKEVPNLEIRTMDEFADHSLQQNLADLIEKGQSDSRSFVEASDVGRVMVEQKYGGIYHDLDYEIFDAQAIDDYMKSFDYFNGREEHNRYNSFSGNAFIATSPHHPVIEKAAQLIKRNLDKAPDAPEYIHKPYNKFDSIICTTGPSVLNIAYHLEGNKNGNNDMMFPGNVLYHADFARDKSRDKLSRPFPETDFDGIKVRTIGGDMFSGEWGHSPEYENRKFYKVEQKVPESSMALYNILEAIKQNDIDLFGQEIAKLSDNLDKILKITQELGRVEMQSQVELRLNQVIDIEKLKYQDQKELGKALYYAVLQNNLEMFEKLLERVTDQKELGRALRYAVFQNNLEMFEKLLERVTDQKELGIALRSAVYSSTTEMFEKLLERVTDQEELGNALNLNPHRGFSKKISDRILALNPLQGFLIKVNDFLKQFDPFKIFGAVDAAEIPSNRLDKIATPKSLDPSQVSTQTKNPVYAEIPSNRLDKIATPKNLDPSQVSTQTKNPVYQAQDALGLAQLVALTPFGGLVAKLGRAALGVETTKTKNVKPVELILDYDPEKIIRPDKKPYADLFDMPNPSKNSNKDKGRG